MQMMHTLQDPPPFCQPMREVREEEHWVSVRENAKVSVAAVGVPRPPVTVAAAVSPAAVAASAAVPQVVVNPVKSEVDSLRNEVKELMVLVTRECCYLDSRPADCCGPEPRDQSLFPGPYPCLPFYLGLASFAISVGKMATLSGTVRILRTSDW